MQIAIKISDIAQLKSLMDKRQGVHIKKKEMESLKDKDFPVYLVQMHDSWMITSKSSSDLAGLGYQFVTLCA